MPDLSAGEQPEARRSAHWQAAARERPSERRRAPGRELREPRQPARKISSFLPKPVWSLRRERTWSSSRTIFKLERKNSLEAPDLAKLSGSGDAALRGTFFTAVQTLVGGVDNFGGSSAVIRVNADSDTHTKLRFLLIGAQALFNALCDMFRHAAVGIDE